MSNARERRFLPRILVCLLIGGAVLGGLLTPIPEGGRTRNALMDSMHGPAFAVLTWTILSIFGSSPVTGLGWAGLVFAAGAAAEGLQSLVGRQPSWHDVAANGFGVLAGWLLAVAMRSGGRRRWARISAALLVLVLGARDPLLELVDVARQRRQFPVLATFDSELELRRWTTHQARMRRSRMPGFDRSASLWVELLPSLYPSVELLWPPSNWRGYDELQLDIFLADDHPLDMILKIHDEQHDYEHADRYHQHLHLTPGPNSIRVPLREVELAPQGRRMDLSRIKTLQLFAIQPKQPRVFYLDNVRLMKN